MIIECPNCQKKFNADSALIPDNGRILQCGICKHSWFFSKNNLDNIEEKKPENLEKDSIEDENEFQDSESVNANIDVKSTEFSSIKVNKFKNKSFKFSRILSYLIVIIISFIAIIILLDTFKIYLSTIFPNLELIIFNLFETLEDIYLFLKNLLF